MSSAEKALETPVMRQYLDFKKKYDDAILFFRMGDFYEMFFDDAIAASEILGLTLTSRHKEAEIPLAGIPWRAADQYVKKLLEAGKKVAVCEQMEKPDKRKKWIKRDVVRILTPGTIVEEGSLVENKSNWLMSVVFEKRGAFLAWVDVSCGDIFYILPQNFKVEDFIKTISPKEIIVLERSSVVKGKLIDEEAYRNWLPSLNADDYLNKLKISGMEEGVVKAIKLLLFYLDSLYFGKFPPLRTPLIWKSDETASLDYNTLANLEIEKTLIGGEHVGSLLWAIDKTQTSMGKRLLSNIIKNPLKNRDKILIRQTCVASLAEESSLLRETRETVGKIRDFERIFSRILVKNGGPREILMLTNSLFFALEIHEKIFKMGDKFPFFKNDAPLKLSKNVVESWEKRFLEEPPLNYKEGGFINPDFSFELFQLSDLIHNSRKRMAALETKERELTRISTLKVGYNRVYGYYFEIPKRFENMVPARFIRKQTTVGGERYFTDELKELEEKIAAAKENLTKLEFEILTKTVDEIAAFKDDILALAKFVSWLDLFCGFAKLAIENDYCRPEIRESDGVEIVDGRHPVVEAAIPAGSYVPTTVSIGCGDKRFSIITGPNMGGKSTLMRMVALVVLLAQTGSYVPAKSAKIGLVDSIFTRIGASDNLSKGESTFLVEMKETASILNFATSKSLIILDEIGRGTGTYDGISLAKAIAEYIIVKINATTLFATHYHMLMELAEDFETVSNFHVTAREYCGKIKFLYQLQEGGSSKSFGVEVAKLTDMPREVVKNAEKNLRDMERVDRKIRFESGRLLQTDIFSMMVEKEEEKKRGYLYEMEKLIKRADPEKITPREAMDLLFQLFDILSHKKN